MKKFLLGVFILIMHISCSNKPNVYEQLENETSFIIVDTTTYDEIRTNNKHTDINVGQKGFIERRMIVNKSVILQEK